MPFFDHINASSGCHKHFKMQSIEKIARRGRSIAQRIFNIFRFDFLFLSLSIFYSFKALLIFATFHLKVKRNCFLFADMNDLKRVLTPGPAIVCNGHMLFSAIALVVSVLMAKRILDDKEKYLFQQKSCILAVGMVQLAAVIDYITIQNGIESLCHSLVSVKYCTVHGVWAIDFRTFTPRYMNAWSFYSDLLDTKYAVNGLNFSWIIFIVLHFLQCRKYKKGTDAEKDFAFVELYLNNNTL